MTSPLPADRSRPSRVKARLRNASLALALMSGIGLASFASPPPALALEFETWLHGSSLMGDVKYQPGFAHFDYVNPDAPKGGVARMAILGNYDSFNGIIPKNDAASGLGYLYDTLMTSSADEVSTEYGLLAEAMFVGPDYSFVKFRLREDARWHDGKAVTVEDVVWSFEKQVELAPQTRFYYSHVIGAEITGEREVTFRFDQEGNRELPHIVGQLTVMPKHWWTGKDAEGKERDISRGTLEPPLGSGPYRIGKFVAGKFMTLERVEDYWAKDLNVNIGTYNFDQIRLEYFRDATVMLENFKSDGYDYRVENTAKTWAKSYTFPAAEDGRVILEQFEDRASGVLVGFIPNLRREKFQDLRIRQAFNHVFNFEEMNRTLFFDQYNRIDSYFFGSELASSGLPSEAELALLEPLRDKVPETVFNQDYTNPEISSREALRDNLQKALDLFKQAGWEPKTEIDEDKRPDGFFHGLMVTLGLASDPTKIVMRNKDGQAFEFEYLLSQASFKRIGLRLQASFERIGVQMTLRIVDSAQYVNRLRSRDFDVIYSGWAQTLSPGNEQRSYFGSQSADQAGSRNYGGIQDLAIDALIDKIIFAKDREELITATRAMDRVLLANYYVIPGWTLRSTRVARWDRFSHPDPLPLLTVGFPNIWWWDKEKAAAVAAKN